MNFRRNLVPAKLCALYVPTEAIRHLCAISDWRICNAWDQTAVKHYIWLPQSRAGQPARKLLQSWKKKSSSSHDGRRSFERIYEDDYSPDSGDEEMESKHNCGAEDGAPDGAGMDSEFSRHGELSASKQLETENDSDNSDDLINHTPAQKSRRRKLSMSPCKLPSPCPWSLS